ncbi:MAG: NUDIX domain-containing protein [Saprospiraceae bacterium]|nr:NUDIX domain-containing protein [Saprospiraceae bacterium]
MKAVIRSKRKLSAIWSEFSQYILEYTRKDGIVEIQKREIHDTGNGSAVLLYNLRKNEIVLIKQFRLASLLNGNDTGILIEVCAGLVEENDPKKTIIKEILEETGYQVPHVEFLFSAYATPGAKTEKIYFFAAAYDENNYVHVGGGLSIEQEDIEVLHLPFDEAWDMMWRGEICDLKTNTLLLYAKNSIFKMTDD